MRREIRRWRLHLRPDKTLTDLARIFNPIIQGWINYYGRFYRSVLVKVLRRINAYLVRWAMRSTSDCAATPPRRAGSWPTSSDASPACSLTGGSACAPTAGRWEPGESRGSRRVLREPGGATPPGHSPGCVRRIGAGARSRLEAAVSRQGRARHTTPHRRATTYTWRTLAMPGDAGGADS